MTDLPSLLVFRGISGIKVGFLQDQWTRLSQSTPVVVPSLGSAPTTTRFICCEVIK